tara:strand:- start:342 stop:575 length:234 start_codon:yes stop_codon:yes gene_type:complete
MGNRYSQKRSAMAECKCKEVIKGLKNDIDRLAEENTNILTISQDHKKINGDLRVELSKAEKKIKEFEENYIKIDGKR